MTIGTIYSRGGNGVTIDHTRALAAFKIGAEAGCSRCLCQLGLMHYEGLGVRVDYRQARRCFEAAAANDDPVAYERLAGMHFNGDGVTPSYRHARQYWTRAVELGHIGSAKNLQKLVQDEIPKVTPPPTTTSLRRTLLPRVLAPPSRTACPTHGHAREDPYSSHCGHEG